MAYDIFISYAHQGDNTSCEAVAVLVAQLHAELEDNFRLRCNRELDIFFDKEDIQDFEHWQVRCHRALRDSRFFIACLSRTYLRSDACRWEWEEWCRHELEHGFVGQGVASLWFVKLEDLDAPEDAALIRHWRGDLLQRFHIQCHEWRNDESGAFFDAAARTELQLLTEHVAQRLRLLALDRARAGNLPWPNANFVGREPELASLRGSLIDAPESTPVGIHGVGGMGKTALAQAFAYQEADAFPGGCWLLRCEGRDRLLTVFHSLVTDLEIELTEEEKLDDAKAVSRVFEVLRPRGRALFLLDNVDHPALLAQEQMTLLADQSWAHLLYTTRLGPDEFTKAGAIIRPLDLDRLQENQAVDLIRCYQPEPTFASPEHEAAAREIVRELSGLTLAVETAAVYLGQCDPRVAEPQYAVDVRNYLNKLREDLKTGGSDGVMSQLREVTATLRPTLARLDAPARTVLQIASLLPPDSVALPWVRAIAGQSHLELATDAGIGENDPWAQLICGLIGMRLFQLTPEPRVVAMHRILQQSLIAELPKEREQLETSLRYFVLERGQQAIQFWYQVQYQWEVYPLLAMAMKWLAENNSAGANLSDSISGPLFQLGIWSQGEQLMRLGIEVQEKLWGVGTLAVATLLNNLALILRATNRLVEAEQMFRRAIAIHETAGNEHPDLAVGLTNLADLLRDTNRVYEAEFLIQKALAIAETFLGPMDPGVAAILNNLANVYMSTGRLSEAEPLVRRALKIHESRYGANHPEVATDLNNLATLLFHSGRYIEAEPCFKRALEIIEEVFDPENPRIAELLLNYAALLLKTNRPDDAEKLVDRALAINKKHFGNDHPRVMQAMNPKAACTAAKPIRGRILLAKFIAHIQSTNNSLVQIISKLSPFQKIESKEPVEKSLAESPDAHNKAVDSESKSIGSMSNVHEMDFATGSKSITTRPQTPTNEFIVETKRRAEAGDASAQCNLGIFYFFGQGVPRDVGESTKWYRRAAEQGDAQAQYNLGIALDRGDGVVCDAEEAFRWFLAAAEGGHSQAQYNVAISYGQGNGVEMDLVEAVRWIILSDQGGYPKAKEVRNMVVNQMPEQQIQEAERRADAFRPRGSVRQ